MNSALFAVRKKIMTNTDVQDFIKKITDGLNPEQAQAVKAPINFLTKIVAGAGTGKTKIISKRFVKLVHDLQSENISNPAERMLVITFTDKAATEMKERIYKELKDNGYDYTGQELSISTFHGFCNKILKKHSIEAGLSPSFSLLEESELKEIFDNIIQKIRYGETSTIENLPQITKNLGIETDILDIKSIKKLSKISTIDSILDSIYQIIKKIKAYGLSPREFLQKTVVSTTNYSRCIKSIPFGFESKEEYTDEWENHLEEYKEDTFIFDVKDFDKLCEAKVILDKHGKRKVSEYTEADDFPSVIEPITELEIHATKIITVIYELYQQKLAELDSCDFDDLINKTIQIFKHNELLRTHYKQLYKHIIVDEFQDTNGSQLELIELLLSEKDANITYVGDRKQSIYGFRFAQTENLEVLHKFAENKFKTKYDPIQLKSNYRSTSQVLDAVNFVTTEQMKLEERLEANPNIEFENISEFVKYTKCATNETAEKLRLLSAKYIAGEILKLKKQDNKLKYSDFAILVRSHNVAQIIDKELAIYNIPCTKKDNTGFFDTPVIKNVIALLRFVMNFRDEIALYKILNIQLSEEQIYRLKTCIDDKLKKILPFDELVNMNFSDKLLYLKEQNVISELELKQNIKDYIQKIFNTLGFVQQNKNSFSLLQLYYKLITEIKPYKSIGTTEYKAEINLRVFEKIIINFSESKNYVSVKMFLKQIEKYKNDKDIELPEITTKQDAVQILTIHASKGLEFPYTFVCVSTQTGKSDNSAFYLDLQYGTKKGFGLIAKNYGTKTSPKALVYDKIWLAPREKAEELRLFYVAITRAKKYLNILKFSTKYIDYVDNLREDLISEAVDFNKTEVEKQKPVFIDFSDKLKTETNTFKIKQSEQNEYWLSFSKLNTFNRCHNLYLYKYKFRFPETATDKNPSLVGSIIHNYIYAGYVNKKSLDNRQRLELIKDIQVSNEDNTKINNLYKTFLSSDYTPEKLGNKTLFFEKAFDFISEQNGKTIKFSGDIDLLIRNEDNTYTIIDFKTNKNIESNLPDYYKQLFIYKTALSTEKINVKEAKLVNICEDGIKEFPLNSEDENEISESIQNEIADIISCNTLEVAQPSLYCKTCGYKYLCNF